MKRITMMSERNGSTGVIKVYGDIVSERTRRMISQYADEEIDEPLETSLVLLDKELSKLKGVSKLVFKVNCDGGDYYEATGMYESIRSFKCDRKEAHIVGRAASAASYFVLACDHRYTTPGGEWMIHSPIGVFMGNPDQIEKELADFRRLESQIADVYAKHTIMKRDDILAAMRETKTMTASEAQKLGFSHGEIPLDESDAPMLSDPSRKQRYNNQRMRINLLRK